MVRLGNIFLTFFSILFITNFLSGCTPSRSYYSRYVEASPGEVFLSPVPNFQDPAFLSKWPAPSNEHEKIRYLLERVASSEHRFIRNGQAHDAKKTRRWLLYKLSHWVSGVETAEDFVTRVASFSQKTGKPYLVEFQSGELYSLTSLLKNELLNFEAYLDQFQRLETHTSLQKLSEAPLSQVPASPPASAPSN